MPSFKYFAKRNLKSGHTAGTEYTITIDLQQLDTQVVPVVATHRSIGGYTVTVFHRNDIEHQVATDLINADGTGTPDTDDFDEFLHSVAGGESFTFNDGSSDISVKMAGKPTRRREGMLYYSYAFKLRDA